MGRTAVSVRRNIRGIRLYYFMWIGGGGLLIPFLGLFFRRQGLSGTQIGVLSTLGAIAGLLAAPVWGRWSDSAARPRRILQVALLATALTVMGLSGQRVFIRMAVIVSIQALVGAATEPLSDTLALSVTRGASGQGFGSVRLWGSLGWAVIVLAGGWLVERAGLFAGFVGYAATLVASALILGLVNSPRLPEKQAAATPRPGVWNIARSLLRDRTMVGLAVALMCVWLASDGLHRFEAIYLDQLGAGESLIGLANSLAAVIELPAMLWADRLVQRHGPGWMLRMALVLETATRAFVLAWPGIPSVFTLRAASGVSFSFYSVAMVVWIGKRAPAQQSATTLAFYAVTLRNLVQIIGAPLNGLAFDAFGAYWLYAIALSGSVLGWLTLRLSGSDNGL